MNAASVILPESKLFLHAIPELAPYVPVSVQEGTLFHLRVGLEIVNVFLLFLEDRFRVRASFMLPPSSSTSSKIFTERIHEGISGRYHVLGWEHTPPP